MPVCTGGEFQLPNGVGDWAGILKRGTGPQLDNPAQKDAGPAAGVGHAKRGRNWLAPESEAAMTPSNSNKRPMSWIQRRATTPVTISARTITPRATHASAPSSSCRERVTLMSVSMFTCFTYVLADCAFYG